MPRSTPTARTSISPTPNGSGCRFCSLQGEHNTIFRPQGSLRTLRWLVAANGSEYYQRHVLGGYSHLDALIGRNARRDVYPLITDHLDRFNDQAEPVGCFSSRPAGTLMASWTTVRGTDMSEQSRESRESAEASNAGPATEQEDYGSLSVEDDPAGTEDPAELAGTAKPDDAKPARPSVSEADEG